MENWKKVLKHYGESEIQDFGDTLRLGCPIHGSSNPTSFVIHKDNKLWYCHSTCHTGGDLIDFVMQMDDVDFVTARDKIKQITGSNITTNEHKDAIQINTEKFIKATQKHTTNDVLPYDMPNVKLVPLKTFRGMDEQTVKHFEVSYAEVFPIENSQGKHVNLYDRLVFPIYSNNQLVGVSLRRVNNKDFAKWYHVPKGLHVGNILYNFDAITPFNDIYVVEGITDVLKLHSIGLKNTVCTFGANLSNQQEKLLLQVAENVVLCYDGDTAGKTGMEKIRERLKYKVNLFIVDLEGGDPCDYSDEELLRLIERRERY